MALSLLRIIVNDDRLFHDDTLSGETAHGRHASHTRDKKSATLIDPYHSAATTDWTVMQLTGKVRPNDTREYYCGSLLLTGHKDEKEQTHHHRRHSDQIM